jgi:hypothetical protein
MAVGCNENARPIKLDKASLSLLAAEGATSLGVGLKYAAHKKFVPETVVVLTDDHENRLPFYASLSEFADSEHIFMLFPPSMTGFEDHSAIAQAEKQGWRVNAIPVRDDWAALDQVSNILMGRPGRTIIDDVLELEFPVA